MDQNQKTYMSAVIMITAIPIVFLSLLVWTQGIGFFMPTPVNQKASLTEIIQGDQIKGDKNAKVELIEYSDFQCPACSYYYPYLNQITEELSGQIRFAYRHFPLSYHKNAELAARAAEAAGKQVKFWEMYNLIFESQDTWSDSNDAINTFTVFATSLGLDMNKFNADINSQEVKDKVANDLKSGVDIGVDATPTFILNGQKLDPSTLNPQTLREQINTAIQNN